MCLYGQDAPEIYNYLYGEERNRYKKIRIDSVIYKNGLAWDHHKEAYEKLERRDMLEEENGNIRIKVDLVRGWLVNGK